MQEIAGLVSIVIPAWNAESFIGETIESVRKQSYTNWELIIVNDGSTDKTRELIEKVAGQKIRIINQANAGVSAARNTGLDVSNGEFIVFLDSDDLLTPAFVEVRLSTLQGEHDLAFVGGLVKSFPGSSAVRKAAADDPEKEILFFDATCATVPSNYLFRKKLLIKKKIRFNTALSSTADRFFILECSKWGKGKSIGDENSPLLYRVSANSMSNKVNPSLINDNALFYSELVKKSYLPQQRQQEFKSHYFYSLAVGYLITGKLVNAALYTCRSLFAQPFIFLKLVAGKLLGKPNRP